MSKLKIQIIILVWLLICLLNLLLITFNQNWAQDYAIGLMFGATIQVLIATAFKPWWGYFN